MAKPNYDKLHSHTARKPLTPAKHAETWAAHQAARMARHPDRVTHARRAQHMSWPERIAHLQAQRARMQAARKPPSH
jgi:hypothetical protein